MNESIFLGAGITLQILEAILTANAGAEEVHGVALVLAGWTNQRLKTLEERIPDEVVPGRLQG